MELVLQASGQSCPIAPGMDMAVAMSFLEMSVVGIPLLLALFQYINDHEYPEPETRLSKRTVTHSIMMALSAFLLWGFYLTAYCVIRVELGANRLTNMLFLFWWVLVIIIVVILSIQLEQMLIERLRISMTAYLSALGLAIIAVVDFFQAALLVRVVAGVTAVIVATVGLASQRSVRSASQDNQGAGAEDADEGMESLDSVYK